LIWIEVCQVKKREYLLQPVRLRLRRERERRTRPRLVEKLPDSLAGVLPLLEVVVVV
jgi:hypothetical protein